ncbi:MAG: Gfo/Idh/MocA family oxidoreductase [Herpetosiphonaceae bacterium]|nr:Gfo/Idh/MocA family oxidoreductase [Herpetosiphonaceae bacterium]
MNDASPLNIAILSAAHGHADSYAQALRATPGANLAGLWDDNAERGMSKAAHYGTAFESDLDRLLAKSDGVIICSENVHHRDLTIRAAQAGKHVLCEKPLAISPTDARAMLQACEQAGVLLGTAFPVRHAAGILSLRDAIRGGTLGQILMLRGTNRGTMPGGWFVDRALSGGGALTDHTVHVVDAIRFITGEEFTTVYAEADTHFYPELAVEDCGLLVMELTGGGIVSLDPSWSRPNKAFPTWGDVTLELTGTQGVASFDYTAQHSTLYSNTRIRSAQLPWGESSDELMVADFIQAIRTGRPPLASGEDGLRAVEVVTAAYESVAQHQVAMVTHA